MSENTLLYRNNMLLSKSVSFFLRNVLPLNELIKKLIKLSKVFKLYDFEM